MELQDLKQYTDGRYQEGLVKIESCCELDMETTNETFFVTTTKETYHFGSEQEADAKIDNERQNPGFVSVTKKFKQGKVSKKTGETLSPDMYIVVVKLNH